jgi:hypothetical protein
MKNKLIFLLVLCIIFGFGLVYFGGSGNNHYIPSPFVYLKANAHSFTPNDYASFIAAVDQFQTELNLVQLNSDNNNLQLLQEHVEKTSKLFYRNLISEFEEQDQRNADNITAALETLQKISSNSTANDRQTKINQIVSDINKKSDEITVWSLEQRQQQSQQEEGVETRFVNTITGFFNNLFGSGDAEQKTQYNIETQALRLAELVDLVLIDYGEAFNVDYDMTDMTNMMQTNENHTSMIMHNMSSSSDNTSLMHMDNTSAKKLDIRDHMSKNHTMIIDMGAYQSAEFLSAKALEIFKSELKPLSIDDDSKAFVTNLEIGIANFINLIRDKAPPLDLMMVAHTRIHPNLSEAYDIKLQ